MLISTRNYGDSPSTILDILSSSEDSDCLEGQAKKGTLLRIDLRFLILQSMNNIKIGIDIGSVQIVASYPFISVDGKLM